MYRIISPSRASAVPSFKNHWRGRGVSERRWRSAANRPSRQARRGWEPEKSSQIKQACRVQQKFNSPKISPPTNKPSPTASPPHAPPSQPWSAPGLFRAKLGPIWVRTGLFRVDSGLFRVKIGPFWAFFPPPESPPPSRETCKNFTFHSPHADASSSS